MSENPCKLLWTGKSSKALNYRVLSGIGQIVCNANVTDVSYTMSTPPTEIAMMWSLIFKTDLPNQISHLAQSFMMLQKYCQLAEYLSETFHRPVMKRDWVRPGCGLNLSLLMVYSLFILFYQFPFLDPSYLTSAAIMYQLMLRLVNYFEFPRHILLHVSMFSTLYGLNTINPLILTWFKYLICFVACQWDNMLYVAEWHTRKQPRFKLSVLDPNLIFAIYYLTLPVWS
jgi:hypothetical protein